MKLYDMSPEEIGLWCKEIGEPAYRAKQLFAWCARGTQIDGMTDQSKHMREKIKELGLGGVCIEQRHKSSDGSEKYLFRCEDGNAVEGVLMQYEYGGSLCVSTQAGCRMGCRFCASGVNGLARNLTAGEIVGELYAVASLYDKRPFNHCVLMGCGEPLDNYNNVIKFLRLATDPKGLGLSARNISLSTCGLVPQIDALSEEGIPVTLCISLHAPNDEIRHQLMPISNKYAIEDVVSAAKRYETKTGRRVVFEYTLVDGLNDQTEHARQLAKLTAGMRKHINLIPLNAATGTLAAPKEDAVKRFRNVLQNMNVSVSVRRTLGADIDGACGQLRLNRG